MVSIPILILQHKCHTGLVQATVIYSVYQHCCLCKGVNSQVELQLMNADLLEPCHPRIKIVIMCLL